MNAPLRTAFWALLFSVTLPLAAFVVSELVSHKSAAGKLFTGPGRSTKGVPAHIVRNTELESEDDSEPHTAQHIPGNVVLGPDVESEESPSSDVHATSVVQERRPIKFQILDATPAPPARTAELPDNRLEARVASLQSSLNRLSQMQLAQAQQQVQQQQQSQQSDQLQQILQQLQQNNRFDAVQQQIEALRANSLADPTNGMQPASPPPAGLNFNPFGNAPQAPLQQPQAQVPAPPVPNQPSYPTPLPRRRPAVKERSDTEESDKEPEDGSEEAPEGEEVPPQRSDRPGVLKVSPAEDGSDHFSLQIKDAEIHEVLEMIGQLSGTNILAARGVTGTVSANLHEVTLEQALNAILKSGDYVHERDGDFIYVFTRAEALVRSQNTRKLLTKVYRPHYISVKDLRALITPILTPTIGKISVTTPPEVGIATSNTNAGGDTMTQRDALLVQDYTEVMEEIDRIVVEMDVAPMQVAIQAHILSVKLSDAMQFGVNFAAINGVKNSLATTGNGQTLFGTSGTPGVNDEIIPAAGQFLANTAGLKYGLIAGDISLFINALENIADTDLVAKPQLLALNKQRAELIIGDRISYKTLAFNGTQTVENVNFLDAGTKLRIRPFIAPDGLIRMEIHPERSSATQNAITGLPNLSTTEVTTNVMVKDGTTIIIGGLIEEQDVKTEDRVPFLGALPVIGMAFRNTNVVRTRNELIVLITPTIVRQPDAEIEGATALYEGERRAEYFRNRSTVVGRANLGRYEFERAQACFDRGDIPRARRHINRSLYYSKNDLRALRLKDQIDGAIGTPSLGSPAASPPMQDTPFATSPETYPEAATFLSPPTPGREPLPVLGDDSPEPGLIEQTSGLKESASAGSDLPPAPPYEQ